MDFRSDNSNDNALAEDLARNYFPLISGVLGVPEDNIGNLRYLSDGISNHSFYFTADPGEYVIRFPKTSVKDQAPYLRERRIYRQIERHHLECTDRVLYLDPENGVRISEYISRTRYPDPLSSDDLKRCMRILKMLHSSGIRVRIRKGVRYELDRDEAECITPVERIIPEYREIKKDILSSYSVYENEPFVFCHGDLIRYNFLLSDSGDRLIDFEYAGMNRPLSDLASWTIYQHLSRSQVEELLETYFERQYSPSEMSELRASIRLSALIGILWYLKRGEPDKKETEQINYLKHYLDH